MAATQCGAPKPPMPANIEWDNFRVQFIEEYFRLHPAVAVAQGRHEYDGQLPDWSRQGLARTAAALERALATARAFDPQALDAAHRIEREYAIATIDGELFWRQTARQPFVNPFFYSIWYLDTLDPDPYLTRDYDTLHRRLQAFVKYAKAVPAAAAQIRANLETPLPKTYVQVGRSNIGGLAAFLASDVPGIFAAVSDPALQKEFAAANAQAARALHELDAWFAAQQASATNGFALGAERFLEMLRRTEALDITIERLRQAGEQDMARNRKALDDACARFAPGATITACIAKVQSRKPAGGPVAGARRQLTDLRAFIEEKQLVSIPGPELANVEESPPYQRWNSAYINIPGPYEKNLPATYYIAPPDPKWTAQEQQAYIPGEADLLFTSVHEVWPGHHLQFMHAARSASLFGRLFQSYAFGEGWAHYSEEMMLEAGLGGGDPAIHIGQLLNALLRNARYLSAIGLHAGTMSLGDSERLFREQAFQSAATARQQAARGTFDPAYLNYTLGKLMIRKLRDDWTATRGGQQAWRQFHDELLSFGGPPVPIIRKAMLGDNAGPAL